MNCEECQPLLEEMFDGEADHEATRRARAHLAACAACAHALEELRREQELYLRYEFDAAPASETFWSQVIVRASHPAPHDSGERASHPSAGDVRASAGEAHAPWRAFVSRLVGAFAAPRFSPTLTAALVLFAVVVTLIVTRYADSRRQTEQAAVAVVEQRAPEAAARADSPVQAETPRGVETTVANEAQRDAPTSARRESASKKARVVRASGDEPAQGSREADVETPDQLVREAGQKYLAAIRLLSRDVRRNRARLDAETAARFERTLATIDRTIAGTRRAVRQHPGDPVAVNYMLAAYARKVEVLREMASY